jgi:ketosteroid isomerase-like protein
METNNHAEDPIQRIFDGYSSAVLAKDTDAFAALYDDAVEVFDMWGTWKISGIAAWRAMADGWFASLGDERVVVSFKDVRSCSSGELASGHATVTYTAIDARGEPVRSLSNRITVAMRRGPTGWKVVHEHTSAPIEHEGLTAILQEPNGG